MTKDFSRLRKQDVRRVLKKAAEYAGGNAPSVRDVRKAVDHDLGIDRAAKATREANDKGIDLAEFIERKVGVIEGIIENLGTVSFDAWECLEETHPGLPERLESVAERLANWELNAPGDTSGDVAAFDYDKESDRLYNSVRRMIANWPEEYRPAAAQLLTQLSKEATL